MSHPLDPTSSPPSNPSIPQTCRRYDDSPSPVMSSTAPTPSIAEAQEKNEKVIEGRYEHHDTHVHNERETDATRVLQRTYRGHRERRQLAGLSLDPSTRWAEAIKEAQYRELTRPRPRTSDSAQEGGDGRASEARQNWRRVGGIARRAGGDEQDDDEGDASDEDAGFKKRLDKQKRTQSTQMMDLSYFLEMVDVQHRYGSNLRKYHAEWKSRGTRENFFYWLDLGDGENLDLENCSRERLDSMKVRYLSREERLNYLTMVDGQGRLCWKKNGIRIDTSMKWKDSVIGIVPLDSKTPTYSENDAAGAPANPSSDFESGEDSGDEASKTEKKVTEVPPDAILNRLVRKSSSKSKWIFVADTSFNLYVGIKQSGAFQHSSFLHGSRISSAGLIKIRDGRIKLLQPRSGHYRPPASNFLAFIHAMRAKGVDMSAASVSASYAALIGIEGYMKGKSAIKDAKTSLRELMSPGAKETEVEHDGLKQTGESIDRSRIDGRLNPGEPKHERKYSRQNLTGGHHTDLNLKPRPAKQQPDAEKPELAKQIADPMCGAAKHREEDPNREAPKQIEDPKCEIAKQREDPEYEAAKQVEEPKSNRKEQASRGKPSGKVAEHNDGDPDASNNEIRQFSDPKKFLVDVETLVEPKDADLEDDKCNSKIARPIHELNDKMTVDPERKEEDGTGEQDKIDRKPEEGGRHEGLKASLMRKLHVGARKP